LSTLLRVCDSYVEVPVRLNPRPDASSGVMKPRVLASLVMTMVRMYWHRFVSGFGLRGRGAVKLEMPLPAATHQAAGRFAGSSARRAG
jgi:hypothetical protein